MKRCYIVPGFLCSSLFRDGPGQGVYWADPSQLIWRGIDPLRLDAAGTGPGSPGGLELYPFGAVGIYWDSPARQLLSQLSPHGYDNFVYGWDWRKRIRTSGDFLGAHILAEIDPAEPCVIACHSAGGLVARGAWTYLLERGETRLIRRIVTLGSPHWGTYAPVETWVAKGDLIRQLKWILNGLAFSANSTVIAGGRRYWSDDDIISLTQTWPAMYDLLPVIGAPGSEVDPDRAEVYDATSYAPGRRPSQAHLSYARDVTGPWLRSAASQPPTHVITAVAGDGTPTSNRLDPDRSQHMRAASLSNGIGDGVVTFRSAYAVDAVCYDWDVHHSDMPTAAIQSGQLAELLLAERSPPTPPPPVEVIPGIVPYSTSMPPIVTRTAGCPGGASRADGSCVC